MAETVIAFDLFGTILSTTSIARELTKLYGADQAKTIAELARRYQLEYTWRANSMGLYRPFDDLTRHSFRQAVHDVHLTLTPAQEEQIMSGYSGLEPFPEVHRGLSVLRDHDRLDGWLFSNGTMAMMESYLGNAQGLSDVSPAVFPPSKMVSVDGLQVYKPDKRTYENVMKVTGATWLVSSNPFDVVGARAAGMKAAWIDRAGGGWVDGLGGALGLSPTVIVGGLDEAVMAIADHEK